MILPNDPPIGREPRHAMLTPLRPASAPLGAISLHDIKNYLNAPELAELVIGSDILRDDIPILHPSTRLTEALDRFARHIGERLPVVTNQVLNRLVGSLAKTDVILALAGTGRRGDFEKAT